MKGFIAVFIINSTWVEGHIFAFSWVPVYLSSLTKINGNQQMKNVKERTERSLVNFLFWSRLTFFFR